MLTFLQGKKTYLIAAAAFIIGGLQALGVDIPAWIYTMLGSLGLGALRAGVAKASIAPGVTNSIDTTSSAS